MDYQTEILLALNRLGKNIYQGTATGKSKIKRKMTKESRRANRKR